jgi:CspA family cold shock protein
MKTRGVFGASILACPVRECRYGPKTWAVIENGREGTLAMTTTNGTIKRITDRGFGFITTPEGVEYFFHQSACADTRFDDLRAGQTVSFTVGQGPKGPRAENVSVR